MPCSQITTNDGFLRRHDGALLVAVEVELPDEAAAGAPSTVGDDVCIKDCAARQDIGSDLLSLLDNPGPTADLTLIATAGSSASRSGADTASSTEEEPPAKKAKTDAGNEAGAAGGLGPVTAGSPESRRFEVHRAILAARCPYFATLFASGMADSDTRELPLPDTDPDALAALLRFMYGGELALASRHQTRTCLVLADRLLLPKAVALLREQLLSSLSPGTIMADLIWAAGPGGQEAALLRELMDFAAEVVADLPEPELKQLAAAQPALMTQLLLASVRAAKRSRS
ncbi:hypothetical protein HYH02_012996 [Chlamydomonas schloesseri]|uniref:BTB domain-containing protein n=1 Tax=Chlamydomonas schloesseri TaxID=2026947 RepID=A0A835T677_9CHLO|nr:hypothetical protein HYH02_012996 [Chlamydomonas schloesseri]|eukprot:KAG2432425.1 hypothetical protein HYH02_012996 [Chlamydomonas schloesseri]